MTNSTLKPNRRKNILLALFFTVVTAGVVLGVTVWLVGGAIGAFLSDEDGSVDAAEVEEAVECDTPERVHPPGDDASARLDDEHWRAKVRRLAEMIERGQSGTFRFFGADLNAMLDEARRHGDFEGRATIRVSDSLLQADVKMPLRDLPILEGRFLDARIILDIALGDGDEKLYIKKLVPCGGDWRTRALLKGLENRDLSDVLEQIPVAEELRQNFRRIAVEDDALVLVTRSRPDVGNDRRQTD